MIQNLGKALSILCRAEVDEMISHRDIDAWGAPTEFHALVSKGHAKRIRLARRHAEAVAKAPLREIKRQALKRGAFDERRQQKLFDLIAALGPYPELFR